MSKVNKKIVKKGADAVILRAYDSCYGTFNYYLFSNEGDIILQVTNCNCEQIPKVILDKFEEFLEAFDSNPFKINEDKAFRKQLIENLITYTYDHMSLITAVVLIKRKFTVDEIIENYYSNISKH